MVTTLFQPFGKYRVFTVNGDPGAFFRLNTFLAGTVNTPKATFQDAEGLVSNTNPVIFNSVGEADIRWANDTLYKIELLDAQDNLQFSIDGYGSTAASGQNSPNRSAGQTTVRLTALAGETVMTAPAVYPAGSIPVGGLIFVETSFGAGQGLSAFAVGTSIVDGAWGRGLSPLASLVHTPANYTNYSPAPVVGAADGIVRAELGGPFDGSGSLLFTAFFEVQTAVMTL
jgi:hypothetical protein